MTTRTEYPESETTAVEVTFDEPVLSETPWGLQIDVAGCWTSGQTGAPAIPRRVIKVALPPGQVATAIDVVGDARDYITEEPALVAPIQPLEHASEEDDEDCRPPTHRGNHPVNPPRQFAPPDESAYRDALSDDRPPARLLVSERIGLTSVAVVEVSPITYAPDGRLTFSRRMTISVRHGTEEAPDGEGLPEADDDRPEGQEELHLSPAQRDRFIELARSGVANPSDAIAAVRWDTTPFLLGWDYLVITRARGDSSFRKKATKTFASAFQRLVDWKWRRGIRSKLVTVEEIEAGDYGDFSTGSRDRPETIRRFLQWAVPRWGVSWVLIGGSDDLIPARRVAGYFFAEYRRQDVNPPPPLNSFWTGKYLRINVGDPGNGWSSASPGEMVRLDDGRLIPYDPGMSGLLWLDKFGAATGVSMPPQPGWYFTTDETYSRRSATPTSFIRVHGLASDVNADVHFVYQDNQLPTDLYFASLFDQRYGIPGKHDWDLLDNGLYGQHTNVDLDGVAYHADVSVGRAPASYVDEANAWVDKVIAYEQGVGLDGAYADVDWHRRVVLAAANWFGRWWAFPSPDNPPASGAYHHVAGSGESLIHWDGVPNTVGKRLIAQVSDLDVRTLPFDLGASTTRRGWRYAVSATDHSASKFVLPWWPFGGGEIAIPTPWIIAFGTDDELSGAFILDEINLDGSSGIQEARRKALPSEVPSWNEVWRLYEDELDLPPADLGAAPLAHLTEARLQAAMQNNPHVVSLSGHGNPGWICSIGNDTWRALTNRSPFITYASGCMTAWYGGEDVMGAVAVNEPHGAVAYVGYSRDGWIGVCDTVGDAFFNATKVTGHLGVMNDARLASITSDTSPYLRWMAFVQNLFGDPEMSIWRKAPPRLRIQLEKESGLMWTVKVHAALAERGSGKRTADEPLKANVHISQGPRQWAASIPVGPMAGFDLPLEGLAPVNVTVAVPGYLPEIVSVPVEGPGWITGKVVSIEEGGDGQGASASKARVRLRLSGSDVVDGRRSRSWILPADAPDRTAIVNAIVDARIARQRISLFVDSYDEGSAIRGFRLETRDMATSPMPAEVSMEVRD